VLDVLLTLLIQRKIMFQLTSKSLFLKMRLKQQLKLKSKTTTNGNQILISLLNFTISILKKDLREMIPKLELLFLMKISQEHSHSMLPTLELIKNKTKLKLLLKELKEVMAQSLVLLRLRILPKDSHKMLNKT